MPSVALIGPDGAGKTTLTRMLIDSGRLPLRYLYMGVSTSSSNLALPTSRLIARLKSRSGGDSQGPQRTGSQKQPQWKRSGSVAGALWSTARLANRVAEEWFRQLVSWFYQLRGYTVLYDRHFVLDFAPGVAPNGRESLDRRIHRWYLTHFYPRPDLVLFLDAPGEVLFARKGELTVTELERRRQALLRFGEQLPNFVRIDATRPLETVYQEVVGHVVRFCGVQELKEREAQTLETDEARTISYVAARSRGSDMFSPVDAEIRL